MKQEMLRSKRKALEKNKEIEVTVAQDEKRKLWSEEEEEIEVVRKATEQKQKEQNSWKNKKNLKLQKAEN